MGKREEFLARYSQASQLAIERDQKLTTAEFMLASNPGPHEVKYKGKTYYSQYSSPQSAGRAFRKVRSGETSGEDILGRGEQYAYANQPGQRGWRMGQPRGMSEAGLWKVIVHYDGTDSKGNEFYDQQKSFIVQSDKYDNYYDAPAVEYETGEEIDAHMETWAGDGSYGIAAYSVTYVEVIRVQYTTKGAGEIVYI